jgi:hypothetical protein
MQRLLASFVTHLVSARRAPEEETDASGHAELGALLDRWHRLRGDAPIPSEQTLLPVNFNPWIANLAIVDIEHGPLRPRYRVVGSRLSHLAGRDLAGRYVDELYAEEIRAEAMKAYGMCVAEGVPHYTHRRFRFPFRRFGYHRLMLPFAGPAGAVDRVLLAIYPDSEAIETAVDWQRYVDPEDLNRWLGYGPPRS